VHRLGLPEDRVQPCGDVGRRSLGVPVIGEGAGDHEPDDEDPAGDDAGRDSGRRHPLDAEFPEQGADPDQNRDDEHRRDAQLEVAQQTP